MTTTEGTLAGHDAERRHEAFDSLSHEKKILATCQLPLVSVVIVNYNYGAFLEDAVRSVLAQTYPHVQCIAIDDCSTDDSFAILQRLKQNYPHIEILRNERNVGQSMSFVRGLAESEGSHLIFVDADDFLLPTCVETHVIAHLSLRVPVGVSSVGMLQVQGKRVITAAFPCSDEYIRSRTEKDPRLLRDIDLSAELEAPCLSFEQLERAIYFVPPSEAKGWPWSPTSGNCFRRDALNLIMGNEDLAALHVATDCYTLRGVTALTGSILIDVPLVAYRLHGTNDFQKSGNLNRVLSYKSDILLDRSNRAMKVLIDYLTRTAPQLIARLEAKSYYIEALDALDGVDPPITEDGSSFVAAKLDEYRSVIRPALGADLFDAWIAKRRSGPARWHDQLWATVRRLAQRLWARHFPLAGPQSAGGAHDQRN